MPIWLSYKKCFVALSKSTTGNQKWPYLIFYYIPGHIFFFLILLSRHQISQIFSPTYHPVISPRVRKGQENIILRWTNLKILTPLAVQN